MQFAIPGEPQVTAGNLYTLAGEPPVDAQDVYIEWTFDPATLQCVNIIPLPPFDYSYLVDINNIGGVVSIFVQAAGFIPIGDLFNPTPIFQSEWLANTYRGPLAKTYLAPENGVVNTSQGDAYPVPVYTQFTIGETPEVFITMAPYDWPVLVERGEAFSFLLNLWNTTGTDQTVDVWIMAKIPQYGLYGPLFTLTDFMLSPNEFLSMDLNQSIPEWWTRGNCEYLAFCGDYPSTIVDEFMFPFKVGRFLAIPTH